MIMPLVDCDLNEADFKRVSEVVYRHCGIALHEGKQDLVRARLGKLVRGGGFKSVSDYLDAVLADPSGPRFVALIDAISTNLTSFFRENRHFEYLSSRFLPELLKKKEQQGQKRLRAWSAGCSTGEEPYSLAVTLLEALEQAPGRHGGWDVKVLATDISTRVLSQARKGTYDKEKVAPVPPGPRSKYFESYTAAGRVTVSVGAELRQVVSFRHLNLIEHWPFTGPFDFIFCRNVMIYFDKPTQETLVGRYFDCLASGGLLFTGHSESLTGVSHRFQYVEPTIYRKS
jgi:chemotaxis protein methyltransferase CheR